MTNPKIAERQQYWLEHVKAAEVSEGTQADYARANGIKARELYQWKTVLIRRGLLPAPNEESSFVCVTGNANNARNPAVPLFCPMASGSICGTSSDQTVAGHRCHSEPAWMMRPAADVGQDIATFGANENTSSVYTERFEQPFAPDVVTQHLQASQCRFSLKVFSMEFTGRVIDQRNEACFSVTKPSMRAAIHLHKLPR